MSSHVIGIWGIRFAASSPDAKRKEQQQQQALPASEGRDYVELSALNIESNIQKLIFPSYLTNILVHAILMYMYLSVIIGDQVKSHAAGRDT